MEAPKLVIEDGDGSVLSEWRSDESATDENDVTYEQLLRQLHDLEVTARQMVSNDLKLTAAPPYRDQAIVSPRMQQVEEVLAVVRQQVSTSGVAPRVVRRCSDEEWRRARVDVSIDQLRESDSTDAIVELIADLVQWVITRGEE